MNSSEAEKALVLPPDVIAPLNLLIQGIRGYFKTKLVPTLTALTDPTLARQMELPVFQRHLHSSSARGLWWANAARGPLHGRPLAKTSRFTAENDGIVSARGLDAGDIITRLCQRAVY